uniref:NmrA-like domain-containing protein n=1 Tax=Minutocellus polymorphus TaxID=265543 RepID=A0A7S0ALL8_9STRA
MGCIHSTNAIKNLETTITVSQSPKRVIVVGASGFVGKATLNSLVDRHSSNLHIYAGVRDPSKFESVLGVTPIKADLNNKAELTTLLKDFDRAFIVTPGHSDRTKLAINGLEAAEDAGVGFVAVVSVLTCGTDSIFGKQFAPIEAKAKDLTIPTSILRLPLFIDNNWLNAESIKGRGTFYDPRDPTKKHTAVAVADVGKAAADILALPEKHVKTTYKLVSPPFSLNDLAAAFTTALGKNTTVTTVPYNAAKEAFMGNGFPEWQVDGILELFHYIDNESKLTNEKNTGDIASITGEKATAITEWAKQVAGGFM